MTVEGLSLNVDIPIRNYYLVSKNGPEHPPQSTMFKEGNASSGQFSSDFLFTKQEGPET